ncbi:MAG: oligosaccharide flippase family protein [Firmicutes bacterium]|jgi:O-antigen/teichoic acid export membrane protein|nr:oligosaccharide flippase family protein [Bacillota bacterium]
MEYIKSNIIKYQDILFPFLDITLNGANVFYHIFLSFYLSQSTYGIISSLFSLLAITFVIGIGLQIYTAKKVAENKDENQISGIFKSSIIVVGIMDLFLIAGISRLVLLTRSGYTEIVMVILIFTINSVVGVMRGIMQGKQEFLKLNISFYYEVISKILLTFLILPVFNSRFSVLLPLLIGMTIALIHGKIFLGKINIKGSINLRESIMEIAKISGTQFFLYYFISINMIVVNYKYPQVSGVYGVVGKYSQIFVHIGFSIITVIIPKLAEKKEIKQFNNMAKKILIGYVLLGITGLIFYYRFLPWTVGKVFTKEFHGAADYIFLEGIAYLFIAICFLLINYEILKNRKSYMLNLLIASSVLTLSLALYSKNLFQAIMIEQIVFSLLALSIYVDLFIRREKDE